MQNHTVYTRVRQQMLVDMSKALSRKCLLKLAENLLQIIIKCHQRSSSYFTTRHVLRFINTLAVLLRYEVRPGAIHCIANSECKHNDNIMYKGSQNQYHLHIP